MKALPRIRPRTMQALAFAGLWALAVLVIVPVLVVLGIMVAKGWGELSWEFVSSVDTGLLAPIVGTTVLVMLTAAIAAPVGVAAAVYLSEYARAGTFVRLVRLAIVNLAGVPSVVYGLFGLALFVTLLQFGRCLLAAAFTMALLVLPLVITASEEALRQVPRGLREMSFALGATRWQTVRRVVLPNALPGIITGMVLSIGRAAGETAPILFTGAFLSLTHPFPKSLLDPFVALTYRLFVDATEVPGVAEGVKWAEAVVLVALVLGLNLGAVTFRARLRRARRW